MNIIRCTLHMYTYRCVPYVQLCLNCYMYVNMLSHTITAAVFITLVVQRRCETHGSQFSSCTTRWWLEKMYILYINVCYCILHVYTCLAEAENTRGLTQKQLKLVPANYKVSPTGFTGYIHILHVDTCTQLEKFLQEIIMNTISSNSARQQIFPLHIHIVGKGYQVTYMYCRMPHRTKCMAYMYTCLPWITVRACYYIHTYIIVTCFN